MELTAEIQAADADLDRLTRQLAPAMRSRPGFGPETTAQLLITAGDNADRIGSEAALAGLCGVSPVQAFSGRTRYHRLNRGGDRQANRALHMIILNRLRYHQTTRAYLAGHSIDGKATPHLRRVLKRYLVREFYQLLSQLQPSTAPRRRPGQAPACLCLGLPGARRGFEVKGGPPGAVAQRSHSDP
jgi:transposase